MTQQEKQINANSNNDNSSSMDAEILEQGDIYFFYRPKKGAEEIKGIEDVRRLFMVTAPGQENNNNYKMNAVAPAGNDAVHRQLLLLFRLQSSLKFVSSVYTAPTF
jgi:hypothetical protein